MSRVSFCPCHQDFYQVHPAVSGMSEEEADAWQSFEMWEIYLKCHRRDIHWIGLRENLLVKPSIFPIKYGGVLQFSP
jgi:hypothetical protein